MVVMTGEGAPGLGESHLELPSLQCLDWGGSPVQIQPLSVGAKTGSWAVFFFLIKHRYIDIDTIYKQIYNIPVLLKSHEVH